MCQKFLPADPLSNIFTRASGISQIASAATTLTGTALIMLRIALITSQSPARNIYHRIIRIMVESAGLSSFVLLLGGALQLIDAGGPRSLRTKAGLAEAELLTYIEVITGSILVGILSF